MEKTIIDEPTGWEYELIGEQYYPTDRVMQNDMIKPNEPTKRLPEKETPIGMWGQRHAKFLKKHQSRTYNEFLVISKLQRYLAQLE